MLIKLLVSRFIDIFFYAYLGPCIAAGFPTAPARMSCRTHTIQQAINTVLMLVCAAIRARYSRSRLIRPRNGALPLLRGPHYTPLRCLISLQAAQRHSMELPEIRRVPPIPVLGPASPNRQCQVSDGCQQNRKTVNSVSATCFAMPSRTQHDLHCLLCPSHSIYNRRDTTFAQPMGPTDGRAGHSFCMH